MTARSIEGSAREAVRGGGLILFAAFVFSFVYNLLRLSGPFFMLLIYDRVLPSRSEETLIALFGILAVFVIAMGMIDYSRRRILARFGAQFQERIEQRLFTASSRNEFFAHAGPKPITGLNELDGLRGFFHSGALISIFDFVWTPMFLIMVFVLHWVLGWVSVGGIALLLVLVLIKMATSGAREQRSTEAGKQIGDLKDLMTSSRDVIRGQDMGASVKERWLAARRVSRDRSLELKDWSGWFEVSSRQIRLLLQYSVLAVGALLTLRGQLTVGAMVAAMFLVSRVFSTVEDFLGDLPAIRRAVINWNSLKRSLAAKEAELSDPCTTNVAEVRARLSLSNVSVRSPLTGELILRSLNLSIGPGKLVEIIGDCGSGKTVLAETILGGWKTSSGTILFGGINIERLSETETAAIFGYVPETVTFVVGTIEENISRLEVRPNRDKIVAAAKTAHVHDLIMALPDGYQTRLDLAGSGLSRGDRHRLALARALYNDPQVLIIDEPDPALREALPKTMRSTINEMKSRGGVIVIFSRERLSLPMTSGQLILDSGRLKSFKVQADNVTKLGESKTVKKVSNLSRD